MLTVAVALILAIALVARVRSLADLGKIENIWLLIWVLAFAMTSRFVLGLGSTYRDIHLRTAVLCTLGGLIFVIGAELGRELLQDWQPKLGASGRLRAVAKTHTHLALMLGAIVGIALVVYASYTVAAKYPHLNPALALRYASVVGDQFPAWMGYVLLCTVGIGMVATLNGDDSRAQKFTSFLGFVATILSTGRTLILLYMVNYFLAKKRSKEQNIKLLAWGVGLFLVISTLNGFLLKKSGEEGNFLVSSYKYIEFYVISGLIALDVTIGQLGDLDYGTTTFRTANAILYRIGVQDVAPAKLVQDYTRYPIETNVYTIYYTYIKDFGQYGALALTGVVGVIAGALERFVSHHRAHLRILAVIMFYCTIMCFFQEQFLTLMPSWIILFATALVIDQVCFTQKPA